MVNTAIIKEIANSQISAEVLLRLANNEYNYARRAESNGDKTSRLIHDSSYNMLVVLLAIDISTTMDNIHYSELEAIIDSTVTDKYFEAILNTAIKEN